MNYIIVNKIVLQDFWNLKEPKLNGICQLMKIISQRNKWNNKTFRKIEITGKSLEFSNGFTDFILPVIDILLRKWI